jgi:hypothetical protein
MRISRILGIALLATSLTAPGGPAAAGQAAPSPETAAKARWLSDHGVPIRTVDPAEADMADLAPLGLAIGNARLVLLGEQSHGDGTTFLMKCRLVRFLHEKMGFDVLAWESGLYDCREMEAALRSEVPLPEAISKGIFAIWGLSRQVRPVFEYARSTHAAPRPLEMAGFDCQFSSPASRESFPKAAGRFLAAAGPAALSAEETALLPSAFDIQGLLKMTPEQRLPYRDFIGRLPGIVATNRRSLEDAWGAREVSFWDRQTRNLGALYALLESMAAGKLSKASDNNARDLAMGETLVWLAN